jgi:hypothetical protein
MIGPKTFKSCLWRIVLVVGGASSRWRLVVPVVGCMTVAVGMASAGTAGAASWAIQQAPIPSGATSSVLKSVSCTSHRACTAVGSYHNGAGISVTLAERWNGDGWEIQGTPNPPGATSSVLDGVSCTSHKACVAVGSYQNSGGTFMLAERWNGARWEIQYTPDPADATSSLFNAVSCTSPGACTAVGTYDSSSEGRDHTLAERWNGDKWTVQDTPSLPPGFAENIFEGVSCPSRSACTAVGITITSGGNTTMAERWNGASWAIQHTLSPSTTDSSLLTVSCTSPTVCTAVGGYNGLPETPGSFNGPGEWTLAESWNGVAWRIQDTPNPAESLFKGVSCPWRTACTAVGTSFASAGNTTLGEGWNGATWTIQHTPNPSGAAYSELDGVSCVSPMACTAVGYWNASDSDPSVLLVERYS